MFINLHFRLIAVAKVLLSKKLLLLFFLSYFLGNLTFAQTPGNCLSFDGSDDAVTLPVGLSQSVANSSNNAITIMYWFRGTNVQSAVRFQNNTGWIVVGYGSSGSPIHLISTESNSLSAGAALNDGKWHHVAMTWQRNTTNGFRSFLDGQLVDQRNSTNNALPNISVNGFLGKLNTNNEFTNGSLDEVRIYNVARTQSEIQADMYSTATTTLPAGLLAYYKMNQGIAGGTNTSITTLTDQTSNAFNGTLNNFALTGTTSNWVESYAMVVPTAPNTTAINHSGFTANWTAPVLGTVENYLLDVATDAAFTAMVSGYNAKNIELVTTFNVTGLEQETTYYWRVRANKTSVTGQAGHTAVQTVITPREALNLTSTTNTNTYNLLTNSAITVDPNVTINYTRNITGFSVVISSGKQSGDVLSYTGTLPSGVLATAYNSSTGVLSFTGTTTPANWQTLMRTVTFRAYNNAGVNRSISFSAGSLNSFTNGHYYEFVSTADTWTNSKTLASNKRYLNYSGYLTTVTSQAENDYIKQILSANAWMGASDEFSQINLATGVTTFANQGASEGKWYWVTGPEAGTQFASSNTPTTPVSGRFNNWFTGEPNNSGSTEHYGQFYSINNGTWNDLSNDNLGYVIEYGGLSSDIVQTPSYTLTMNVSGTPPGNALDFDGTNDYVNLGTNLSFPNTTPFTIEAWVNRKTSGSGNIVSKINGGVAGQYYLNVNTNGTVDFQREVAPWVITSTAMIPENKWSHIAATYNGTTMTIYINGVASGSIASGSVGNSANPNLLIGARESSSSPANFFGGKIDEVRFWNVARTQAEIVANMYAPIASTTANLVSYFNFDQGTPSGTNTGNTRLHDQTTNIIHGTMNGFALSGNSSNWVESYAMVVPKPATTTAITSNGFTANWSASTIGTADNYLIDVSTNTGFTSFVTGYNNKNVGTSTSFAVTGLSYNTTYYWRVRADKTSVTGQGGYSTQTVLTLKESINITSTTTSNTFNLLTNSALIVDANLAINYSQNIDGFRVIITTNKQDGDILAYTGALPSGITPVAYNASTGVLAFTGTTSAANWQTFLRTVTFRAYKNSSVARSISFSAGSLNSFSNGHFYELVTSSVTWANAKTAAAAKSYLNYTGYLATVTSSAENDYIKQILSADAWMGATDDYSYINAVTGATTYADQNASEGKWSWVTGPEAGTQFWNGNGSGSVLSENYANWYTPSSEPNNAGTTEHYGQFYSTNNGTWNDLNGTAILGYLVEYGGLATDIVQTPSYSVTINVTATEPGNALNFNGTNSYVNIPDANSLDLTNNYTIEAWIKPDAFTFLGGIVDKYQTSASYGYTLRLTGSSPYNGISFDEMSTANGILTTNKWYHIAAVNSNGTRTLYINGVSVPLTGTPTTVVANTDPLRIGCDFSTRFFNGNIDEVRIWNVARSQAQIVANMNGPIALTSANLVSYYNFNEGITNGTNTGLTTLYDQTTTLNNGTLNNFGLSGTTTNWVESYAMVVPTTIAATSKYSLGFTANWTASTIGTTEKYYLDVATDAAFTSLVSGYSNKDVNSVTSFTVNTGLSANTTYYYRVRAEKSSVTGTGAYSNSTSVTTDTAETLVANAASDRTSVSFTANWSEPTLNNISAYLLDVSTVSNFATFVSGYEALSVSELSQSVTGLTPNTVYYYRVRVAGYNNSNTITTSTIAPFASIATSVSAICKDGASPTITFTGSGSLAPYTFTYTINGGSNQTITTTSGNTVTLSVPTNTAGTFTYALVSITDASGGTNPQSDSTEIIVNPLLVPTFSSVPDAATCSSTDVTYTTQSGQTNYIWTLPGTLNTDYTITSGGIGTSSSTVTLKWLTSGGKTVTVDYTNSTSCTSISSASAATTVSLTPTVAAITGTTTTTEGLSTTLSNSTLDGVWNSSNAAIASVSSTGIVTAVGQGTATITYTVTSGSCSNFATTTYTVNAAPVPTITAVSPLNPIVGATVTITGTNFLAASLVSVGSYQVTFTIVSATTITFTLPTGTGTNLAVAVTTPGGTATSNSSNLITYNTAGLPTITSFSPTSAGTGQTIVITGTNLINPSTITFGGTDVASYTVNSASQITVVIGSGTSGSVVVTTAHPTPASITGFTYLTCSGNPTLYSGGSLSMCASESPFNITTDSNASNYSALSWSTSGTGTFVNNTTADALTNTTYEPSIADITAGSVVLILTATANSGCMDQTSSKTLTIYPTSDGGIISGSASVCAGTNNTTLTLSGNTGDVTKWQYSSDDFVSDTNDIANTTNSLTATNLIATTYYRAIVTSGSCASETTVSVMITVNPTSIAGSIDGATSVCTGTNNSTLTLSGNTGDVTKWQYSSDNFVSDTNDVANTTTTLIAENLTATTYFRAVVNSGSCSSATTASVAITILTSNIWNGSVSTDWNTADNWNCGVPASGANIEIPSALTNYPELDSSRTIGNIILASGATLNLNNFSLNVSGTFSGTGTLIGSNTSNLSINGSGAQGTFYMDQTTPGTTNVLNNFTLNSTTSGSVTLGTAMGVSGTLTLTNGTFNTGGNLTLKSNSAGTAVVAPITDCLNVAITGDVTVERFFPARRAFRFISSPVTTSTTIRANWQEGQNNLPPAYTTNSNLYPGYGTHITGNIVGTNGFDATQTTNNSMFTYNNSIGAWAAVPNTNALTLTAGVPYRLLIRGDRSIIMNTNNPDPTDTTLRAKGTLKICEAAAVTLSQNANGFSFIGNPYQATVDIKEVLDSSTNLNTNYYWVWDPKINTRGGYVAYDLNSRINPVGPTSSVNEFLQPWQACFVKTSSAGAASITFQESNKATSVVNENVFRNNSNLASYIRLTLYESNTLAANGVAADGVIVKFGDNFSNAVDANDATKFSNQDEMFSTKNNTTLLGIESRLFPMASDIIPLNISQYRFTAYTMVASGTNITGLTAYLHDQLLQTYTEIPQSGSVNYSYVINASDSTTSASDRFRIVFQNPTLNLENTSALSFTMYPNPSKNGDFDVVMNGAMEDTKLIIYNAVGQEVYATNLMQTAVNQIKPNKVFAKGIYYVKIKKETTTIVKKLIIE